MCRKDGNWKQPKEKKPKDYAAPWRYYSKYTFTSSQLNVFRITSLLQYSNLTVTSRWLEFLYLSKSWAQSKWLFGLKKRGKLNRSGSGMWTRFEHLIPDWNWRMVFVVIQMILRNHCLVGHRGNTTIWRDITTDKTGIKSWLAWLMIECALIENALSKLNLDHPNMRSTPSIYSSISQMESGSIGRVPPPIFGPPSILLGFFSPEKRRPLLSRKKTIFYSR